VRTALAPERAPAALARLRAALAGIRDGDDELAADFVRARRRVVATRLAHGAGASSIADELDAIVRRGGDPRDPAALARATAAVTLEDLRRVAARDLDDANMVFVLDGPKSLVTDAFAAIAPDATIDWVH
jgi:predicted Zn-dependent peptidase